MSQKSYEYIIHYPNLLTYLLDDQGQQNQGQYKVQMDYYMVEEKVAQEPQNTYMLFSTLNICFCCLFMGIVSCIYSFRTRYSNSQGMTLIITADTRVAVR